MKKNISLLEKSVNSKESRLTSRVLRSLGSLRRRLTVEALVEVINSQPFTESEKEKSELLKYLEKVSSNAMQLDVKQPAATGSSNMEVEQKSKTTIPEVEIYLTLLVIIFLIDKKDYDQAVVASTNAVNKLNTFNRRTLYPLSSKIYFYYARSFELTNKFEDIRG